MYPVQRTVIEALQFVARLLRVGHALEERVDSGIVFAPEVVGN